MPAHADDVARNMTIRFSVFVAAPRPCVTTRKISRRWRAPSTRSLLSTPNVPLIIFSRRKARQCFFDVCRRGKMLFFTRCFAMRFAFPRFAPFALEPLPTVPVLKA